MVERNGTDYAAYLNGVFHDDPDFRQAADNWAVEEVQHGDALGRWAMLADPSWDYPAAFDRYQRRLPDADTDADASIRGSRTGELIARCMVETGTSSYYSALADATEEPVLQADLPADRRRRIPPFQAVLRPYAPLSRAREHRFLRRLRIAAGRIGESEDDELAFAFHCGNESADRAYDHERCIAALYVPRHGLLSVPPYRARHGDDLQGGRAAAARAAVGPFGAVAWRFVRRRQRGSRNGPAASGGKFAEAA